MALCIREIDVDRLSCLQREAVWQCAYDGTELSYSRQVFSFLLDGWRYQAGTILNRRMASGISVAMISWTGLPIAVRLALARSNTTMAFSLVK